MDRNVAEKLMSELVALGEPLNAATTLTAQIVDEGERAAIRKVLGDLMSHVYLDLMRPIIRQYPDLDPDRTQN